MQYSVIVHEINKFSVEWWIISLQIFGKGVISWNLIDQNDLVNKLHPACAFFHFRIVKGTKSNMFTCKLRAWQLFLNPWVNQIKSYSPSKTANSKAFSCKLCDNTTYSKILITWAGPTRFVGLANTAEVTFILVFHDKGQTKSPFLYRHWKQRAWDSVLPAVLFFAWFIRRAARPPGLLGEFPTGILSSQYWDPN